MTEQSMVGRVARAIHDGVLESTKGLGLAPETCEMTARAAIEAMRIPRHEMVKAVETRGTCSLGIADLVWVTMIDAALK